jgi:hypothetical protein
MPSIDVRAYATRLCFRALANSADDVPQGAATFIQYRGTILRFRFWHEADMPAN